MAMTSTLARIDESVWRPLYKVGGFAAVAMLLLLPVAMFAFMVAPPPEDAASAFALFQRDKLLGLLSLDLVYMFEIFLAGVVLLVVSVALRRASPSFLTIAAFLNVTATAIYFASNPAFEMLTLSKHHASATTDAQRAIFLSAGESMLATYTGTAYNVSYVMAGLAGLVVALVMFRSDVFSRTTAYLGVMMGVLALIPPTIGTVGLVAAFLYLVPLVVWSILVARRLLLLGREHDRYDGTA